MDRTKHILVLCFLLSLASVAFAVCVEEVYEGVSWAETEPGTNATNPYACGQLAQGAYYRYCHENSTWDDTIIVDCVNRTCVEEIYDGITYPETNVNSSVTVDCGEGYIGSITRFCSIAGTWEAPEDSCIPVCNATVTDGVEWPETPSGSTAYVNCSIGYTGQYSRECVDGLWGEVSGSCSIVVCEAFTDDTGLFWASAVFNESSSVPCEDGMVGSRIRTCLANGTFSDIQDFCTSSGDRCLEETIGEITWPETEANTMAQQPCGSGFIGFATRYCSTGGVWNEPDMTGCTPAIDSCASETVGGISWPTTSVNDTATQPCGAGYEGTATRYCGADGVWEEPDTSNCKEEEVFCPEKEEYGYSWPRTPANEIATVPCMEGYTGLIERRCSQNGEWGTLNDGNCVLEPSDSPNVTLIVIIVIVVIVVLVVLVVVLLYAGSGRHYNAKRAQRKMVELAYV